MRVIQGAAVVATAIAAVLAARPASACGGCFHVPTPEQTTVVTGHRMAFSISPIVSATASSNVPCIRSSPPNW